MDQLCSLLLLTLALTAPDAAEAGLIIGGKPAVPHSRPYMVLVERHVHGKINYCGGSLLSVNFVMTAAHCDGSSYKVLLGLHDYKERHDKQRIDVEKTFIAEGYNADTLQNEVLLLKLSQDATLSPHVRPIPLAGPQDRHPHLCSVAGWGSTEPPSPVGPAQTRLSYVLMEVNVTVGEDCDYGEDFYCSQGRKGVGLGDSGGPLVCEDGKAYGVVSGIWQNEKGVLENLFSKIPKHKEWVDSIMSSA